MMRCINSGTQLSAQAKPCKAYRRGMQGLHLLSDDTLIMRAFWLLLWCLALTIFAI
jgi:hypothetical protein